VKFIEQQLLAVIADTPAETDCSVSAAVLVAIGLRDAVAQEAWLEARRPATNRKKWFLTGERWEYALQPSVPIPAETSFALRREAHFRSQAAAPAERPVPIMVKAVQPLSKRPRK
jgi:hypothetical protein